MVRSTVRSHLTMPICQFSMKCLVLGPKLQDSSILSSFGQNGQHISYQLGKWYVIYKPLVYFLGLNIGLLQHFLAEIALSNWNTNKNFGLSKILVETNLMNMPTSIIIFGCCYFHFSSWHAWFLFFHSCLVSFSLLPFSMLPIFLFFFPPHIDF